VDQSQGRSHDAHHGCEQQLQRWRAAVALKCTGYKVDTKDTRQVVL